MAESVAKRLANMGIVLPDAAAPAANYVPIKRHGDLLFVSGQLPIDAGALACRGRVGEDVAVDAARHAARLCAINVLAQVKAALQGDLERITNIVRITAFVASAADFVEQHLVANGASDFLVEALGDRGRHARAAVGVAALPLGAAVEVDAIVAVA